MQEIIVIAGGSGLLGKMLFEELVAQHYNVRILTRQKKKCDGVTYFYWNPLRKEIDPKALENVSRIINLSGAGIADKRWCPHRKKELIDSRVFPALFLADAASNCSTLRQYVTASGINCYPLDNPEKVFNEEDEFGSDFLSEVVQQWEMAADCFQPICQVTKLRISTVLSSSGGALAKMAKPFKFYIGSPLGSGNQVMSWVHESDLVRALIHLIQKDLEGVYNLTAEQITNKEFSKALAKRMNRPMLPMGVPRFMLKLLLGEMSDILVTGVKVDASKLKSTGFTYDYPHLQDALASLKV